MRNLWLGLALVAAQGLLFGQLDDNTLTVTATSTANVQPDQAAVLINVSADGATAFDDILAAVQGAGVSATNLEYVQSSQYVQSGASNENTQWTFLLPVAFAKLNSTLASLDQIAAGVAKSNPAWQVTYYVQGTQLSPELQAAQTCARTALVGAARAQAQVYAAAAGGRVGPIVALSDGVSGGVPTAAALQGDFSQVLVPGAIYSVSNAYTSFLLGSPAAPACSMTVQFQLLR